MSKELAQNTTPILMNLNECIAELDKHGLVRIHQHEDKTWSCKVKMNVTTDGAVFEIKSGFHHDTIDQATNACVQRMRKTLRNLK